jgi:hypothetical protein
METYRPDRGEEYQDASPAAAQGIRTQNKNPLRHRHPKDGPPWQRTSDLGASRRTAWLTRGRGMQLGTMLDRSRAKNETQIRDEQPWANLGG